MAVTENGGDSSRQLHEAGFTQSPEGRNWYRRGRLLALQGEADKVEYAMTQDVLANTRVVRERVGPGLVRFSWDTGRDPGEVIDDVRLVCQREWGSRYAPKISPDHLFGVDLDPITGQPFDAGGPAGFPQPPRHDDPDELAPRTAADSAGDGVVVGVVDTGISRGSLTGPATQDWLEGSFLATPGDFDELNHGKELGIQAGHGTFVAGVVLQHAPGATVRIAKALQPNGIADGSDVALAIDRLARSGIHVLNLSLGCFSRHQKEPIAVEDALRRLDSEIVVVAAAGNLHTGRPGSTVLDDGHGHSHEPVTEPREFWPAAFPWVFSVGALQGGPSPRLADFSNFGAWVTAYTQGVDVFSTFLEVEDTRVREEPKQFKGYAYWSGTSFAAPAVAGAIAGRMQQDNISAQEAAERIKSEATQYERLSVSGLDSTIGSVLRLEPQVRPRRRSHAAAGRPSTA